MKHLSSDTPDDRVDICPISGLRITRHPDWYRGNSDSPYRVKFNLVGDHILFSHPSGFATSESTKRSLQLNQMVEDVILKKKTSYVQIENFTELESFTINARLTYISHFKDRPGISGLIFFGVSPLTSLSIKIAVRLYLIGFPVKVVNSYEEAVRCAVALNNNSMSAEFNEDKRIEYNSPSAYKITKENHDEEMTIQSDPSWTINMAGYMAQYEIINGHILHSITNGYFSRSQIKPVIELQERLFKKFTPNKYGYHMIADVSKITGTSYRTRRAYTQAQKDFYSAHRFESLTFYGASKILKAAVYLGRPFVKFKIFLADSLEEGLNFIYKRSFPSSVKKGQPLSGVKEQKTIDGYTMDVLRYLGTLNLDVETSGDEKVEFREDHPFRPVFDTIDLINHDLKQLVIQRQKDELLRIELERKLANAQKMEALGTLSGGIAHDFNNILSGMLGYCQLAKMNIEDPEKAKDKVEQIKQGALRAADLVRQILIFSRDTEYKKYSQNLAPVVKEAVKLLKSSIAETIEIQENIDSRESVMADSGKIYQVVTNLCANAYQSMHDTGGVMTVSLNDANILEPETIHLQMAPGKYLKLEVSDTGHGMDDETLKRIFDPYFTTKALGKGTGLGLSMAYAIVQEHGGYIKVDSQLEKGSMFTVYLPVTDRNTDFQKHMKTM